jgi:hypothetical protein
MNTIIIENLPPPIQFNIWDYGQIELPDLPAPETESDSQAELLDTSRELYQLRQAVGDLSANYGRLSWVARRVLAGEDKEILAVELRAQGVMV